MLSYAEVYDFCIKHQISIEGFFLAFGLYMDRVVIEGKLSAHRPSLKGANARPLAKIFEYAETVRPWSAPDIKRMIEKGFLKETPPVNANHKEWGKELVRRKNGEPPMYYLDYVETTQKFEDAILATYTRFEEFWDTYPYTMTTPDGKVFRLKAVDKDKTEKLYKVKVQTKSTHEEVMKALRWAIENNDLFISIDNYLGGENWKGDLERMKDGVKVGSTWI